MPIKGKTLTLDGHTLTIEELMKAGNDLSIKVKVDEKNWPKRFASAEHWLINGPMKSAAFMALIQAAAVWLTISCPEKEIMIFRKTLFEALLPRWEDHLRTQWLENS